MVVWGNHKFKKVGNHELYELNMHLFTWTHIHTGMPKPHQISSRVSLTSLTDNRLVLYVGSCMDDAAAWIFDVESYQWRKYKHKARHNYSKLGFTGIPGLNNDVIIVGKHFKKNLEKTVISVMLEPKSLQQLAVRKIHQCKTNLPWKSLPLSLRCKLLDSLSD